LVGLREKHNKFEFESFITGLVLQFQCPPQRTAQALVCRHGPSPPCRVRARRESCAPRSALAESMDPILVKGLREAKQLHDNGILSLQEFEKEKQVLLQKRDLRLQREQARASFEDPELKYRHDGANNTFCSRCGLPGHNKRSCSEDLEALGGKKRRKKGKWDLLRKRGAARPRWSREPTCYALFFGSGNDAVHARVVPCASRAAFVRAHASRQSLRRDDKTACFVFAVLFPGGACMREVHRVCICNVRGGDETAAYRTQETEGGGH
jgi:hypothetical protein